MTLGPRLVVAGTRSGVGKTTVATGLMAAFARRGRRVASAKVGPDFIDPGYHSLATGRPGRNLDIWMSGADAIAPLAGRASVGAELLVVEGVMGLFDGAADGTPSSTAEVAKLLDAPVVLVVDAASMSQSVAALVHGYRSWDPAVRVEGVILNLVAGDSHERMLRAALAPTGVAVLGVLTRDDSLAWRSRHLGLHPVAENPVGVRASLNRLAAMIEARCDLDGLQRLAATAPAVATGPVPTPGQVRRPPGRTRVEMATGPVPTPGQVPMPPGRTRVEMATGPVPTPGQVPMPPGRTRVEMATGPVPTPGQVALPSGRTRVAVAAGAAFSFCYPDNLEALAAAGAEVVPFDPCTDAALPEGVGAVVAGGGFPEVFAEELSANRPMLESIRAHHARGGIVWAECGGLLWLARSLDGWPMAGIVAATATLTTTRVLGYRTARTAVASPLGPAGTVVRGHEFHYSALDPPGDALELHGRHGSSAGGFATPRLLASYLHIHLAARPDLAEAFVNTAAATRSDQPSR